MSKILSSIIFLIAFTASADEDPCDLNNYPIKNSRKLEHPTSYSLPSIFYNKNNATVIVPVKVAIELTKENLNDANSVLKLVKENILSSLNNIEVDEFINSDSLWTWPSELSQENYEVAIQTVIGYQAIYEKSLLRNLATVKISGSLIKQSYFKYMHGKDLLSTDGYSQVHKVVVTSNKNSIYERCWIDK